MRLFARYRGSNRDVIAISVRWIVLDHEVGSRLPHALGIFVDKRLLVIVGFCVVNQTLAVALDLSERRVLPSFQLVLRHRISQRIEISFLRAV